MNIIIDSNILFSALIKDSLVRKIILEYNHFFIFPEYIFEELQKHKSELIDKSGLSKEEFDFLINLLLSKVIYISNKKLVPFKKKYFL